MSRFVCVVLAGLVLAGCFPTIHKVKLSDGNQDELHPVLFVRGSTTGTVFTVWVREGAEEFDVSPQLFFRRGGLRNASFSPLVSLGPVVGATEADLAVTGSHVYVAFADGPVLSATDAVLQASHDTGDNFERVVLSDEQPVRSPRVAAQGQDVHVAWSLVLAGVRYRRSTDAAASFDDVVTIAEEGGLGGIAADAEHVFLAVVDTAGLHLVSSGDSGGTFADPVPISSASGVAEVAMRLDGTSLHLLWTENAGGQRRLMHAHLEVGAGQEPSVRRVDDGAGSPARPALAVEGARAHVVWTSEAPNQSEVLYAAATGSDAFSEPLDLSASPGTSSLFPDVSAAGGRAHVVWMEGSDVVYRRGSTQSAFSTAETIEPTEAELVGVTPKVHGRLEKDRSVLWISRRISGSDVWYYSYRPWRID